MHVIEPLAECHPREAFSCDHPAITEYFRKRSYADHLAYKVRIQVACTDGTSVPIGFYSLVVGTLAPKTVKQFDRKFGRRDIPSIYLAAVAVQVEHCGRGVGTSLMLDAFEKVQSIASVAGVACMTLDAVSEAKARWYEKLQFERFGVHDDGRIKMFIPLPTLRDALT